MIKKNDYGNSGQRQEKVGSLLAAVAVRGQGGLIVEGSMLSSVSWLPLLHTLPSIGSLRLAGRSVEGQVEILYYQPDWQWAGKFFACPKLFRLDWGGGANPI